MGQKKAYKQYPKKFKEETVNLVFEQGYSVPEAAKPLDIAIHMLYRWKQQIEDQRQVVALERTSGMGSSDCVKK